MKIPGWSKTEYKSSQNIVFASKKQYLQVVSNKNSPVPEAIGFNKGWMVLYIPIRGNNVYLGKYKIINQSKTKKEAMEYAMNYMKNNSTYKVVDNYGVTWEKGLSKEEAEKKASEKNIHHPITDKNGNQAVCPKDKITPLKHYDGALGYEALFCTKCGYFEDFKTKGKDKFFVGK